MSAHRNPLFTSSMIAAAALTLALAAAGCSLDDAPTALPGQHASLDSGVSKYKGDGSAHYSDSAAMADAGAAPSQPIPAENYGKWVENDFVSTSDQPTSTFSVDVDTAAYTVMRQALTSGLLPDPEGVRVEEYVNYFSYSYPQPGPTAGPFSINMEAGPSHFGAGYQLMRVGLQGLVVPIEDRKQANLVFLIDQSGSMSSSNKLPLVKYALTYLVGKLESTDTLGIVTYASTVNELLQPTAVKNKSGIVSAINSLSAAGGTSGGPGLQKAYDMAKKSFIKGGVNRVILCTDGDFNIGISGKALIDYVVQKKTEDVTLSVLGFGMGNYKDTLLEELSNKGNGNYAYIDNQAEAEKVFGDKLVSTLQVIAKDVKVQVEFNPKAVSKYRLVGYENRLLKNSDFKNDSIDAGEIGSGHSVTAFYELELLSKLAAADILATTRFRYKDPDGAVSKELTRVIRFSEVGQVFTQASPDFRFAAAVVEFAEILRKSKHSSGALFGDVKSIASATAGTNADRLELLTLVDKAKTLWP